MTCWRAGSPAGATSPGCSKRSFAQTIEEHQIPPAYHTERLRNAMLDDLLAFAAAERMPPGRFDSRMEEKFEYAIAEGLLIAGKIDRLDIAEDGTAYVIDYKYSNAQNTRKRRDNRDLLQAPLYLLAVEKAFGLKAAGMYYIGLKGGIEPVGWEADELPEGWLEATRETTLRIVREIRGGHLEVKPSDRDKCKFCDCVDVCRVEIAMPAARAEGE